MTHAQWFEIAIAEMLASDPELAEETLRLEGSTTNDTANAVAAVGTTLAFLLARLFRARFFDTARGDDLTRLIVSDYGIPRQGATAARVTLVAVRTNTFATSLDAGFVIVADGQRFALDLPVTWAEDDIGSKVVQGTALEVGPNGNVPAGRSWTMESSAADSSITFTNAARASGGNNEEQDDDYRARTRDVFARFVRATLRALVIGAREVPRVRSAAAYESVDGDGYPNGGAYVVVADENGYANAAMASEVEEELEEWRGAGIRVLSYPGEVVLQAISYTPHWNENQATDGNNLALRRAIVARVNRLIPRAAPVGVTADVRCVFRPKEICAEAAATVPGCSGVTVISPIGDVTPDPLGVIRTTLALVTPG